MAPCEMVTVFGSGLGPASPVGMQLSPDGRRAATTLGGTRILFEGVPAPLVFVSASQVSVVVPCVLAGRTSARVQVEYLGESSPPVSVPLARVRPGIFTLSASGRGQGAALNWPDHTVNRAGNAAPRGSVVSVYASSGGWTSPPAEDGRVADQALPLPLPVTATVGGLNAPVLYAGAAPSLLTGVLQVNLQVPADAPVGDAVPLSLTIGGVSSPAGVTLAIRSATAAGSAFLTSPYVLKAGVYKGQLHCHSTNSDGAQDPATVVTTYRDAGYHFVSLTDHDRVTPDPGVPGVLFLPGIEQHPNGNHLNRINVPDVLRGNEQAMIDATLAQGGFIFLNHPNWPGGYPDSPNWTDAEMEAIHSYHGIEVWNSLVAPNSNAENRVDHLLTRGRRLFLLATDDCHNVHNTRCMTASTVVFADRLETDDIMHNLKSGNFYASSGATISSVSVAGRTFTVTTDRLSNIHFITAGGRIVQSTYGAFAATYTASGDEVYIRAKIVRTADAAMAWTNPVYPETR